MKYQNIILSINTLGPYGYCTGSGTVATLITVPFALVLRIMLPSLWYGVFIVCFTVISYFIIKRGLDFFEQTDPSQIVLDEVVGCFITFYALPLNLITIISAFLLFRFFDIAKCFGIKSCESLDGAWGVLMDDVLAGIFANLSVRLMYYLFIQ